MRAPAGGGFRPPPSAYQAMIIEYGSVRAAARELGVTKSALDYWARGVRSPGPESLRTIQSSIRTMPREQYARIAQGDAMLRRIESREGAAGIKAARERYTKMPEQRAEWQATTQALVAQQRANNADRARSGQRQIPISDWWSSP